MRTVTVNVFALLFAALLIIPHTADAVTANDYCITPPFITAGVKPNLLLLIDNSASMYDLANVDKGKKHCSITTGTGCFYDTDCPSGETCSVFDRAPFYCYDETYKSSNDYYGYFDKDKYYTYRSGTDDFAEVASAFPAGCGSVAAGSTTNTHPTPLTGTTADAMCIEYLGRDVKSFVAKGNYLNWLTASKFDIEKKILTGGLYDGTGMIPESRGCVGRSYVKQALTKDFINFSGSADNDLNMPLPVTFNITGPLNSFNTTAPSTGGQTYINLYAGKTYNYRNCQDAIQSIATGTNADIKKDVDDCLASTAAVSGYCQQKASQTCTTSSECVLSTLYGQTTKVCSLGTNVSCTADANCLIAARQACSLDASRGCTSDSNCQVAVVEKLGTCGTWSPALPNGSKPPTTCTSACTYTKSSKTYTAPCDGYIPAGTTSYGTCVSSPAQNFGSCVANYTGPCVLPGGVAAVKTKVSFQQSMQACWALRNGKAIGVDDVNTVKNQCSDIYGSYATCSNNHLQFCDPAVANSCGSGNSCDTGPNAITPGNPGLLCGQAYEGQFYVNSGGAWVLSSSATTQQMIDVHTQFCSDMERPNVTDPTDSPSNSPTTDNLPAIISSIGVEAQLGSPVATMRAKVAVATPACTTSSDCASGTSCVGSVCKPSGLVQEFGNLIRLGAMSFNPYGSASETALTRVPKTCPSGAVCTQDADCSNPPVSGRCAPTTAGSTNLDGGRILYPIGKGLCATMTSNACTADSDCAFGKTCLNGYCGVKGTTTCTTAWNCSGSNQACISDGVGDHTTSATLIKALDSIPANTWTPFAEGFYNALGYFAQMPSGADAGKSRTDLRLNAINTASTDYTSFTTAPVDFNENYNPSEFRCQQNFLLLISDGSSTADRNTRVNDLATLYAAPAGITQTTCTGAPAGTTTDYGGNNNLPILAWLAKNRNISTLSTSTASTALPGNARDSITSYVVFTGESNGASGDCNSQTLLSKTAVKGGTTMKQANNYTGLVDSLRTVFQDVAAKAASGTAASILSNSEGSGANILQAVFYPKKIYENGTAVNWIGEMQNLWYFIDPYINSSTIREDTDGDLKLNLLNDYVARFAFDNSSDKTMVQLSQDTNGDGSGDLDVGGLIDPDYVKSIWRAGKQLWARDITTSPRTIKTSINGTSLLDFSSATLPGGSVTDNSATLAPYLNVAAADAPTLINWVHGLDYAGYRRRTVDIKNPSGSGYSTGVWKLGDIISSTPRVQSTVPLQNYNLAPPAGYSDATYRDFTNTNSYKSRGMVYVGANDGMLHAFNMGILSVQSLKYQKASLGDPDNVGLGKEMWAYIPRNYLPYLKYLSEDSSQHLYGVDGRTVIVDASIGDDGSGGNYWDQTKTKNTWRTVVIGSMGIGGASRRNCATPLTDKCVPTPINDPADGTKSLGYSTYFALDVTDQNNPTLLWEFGNDLLGYSTTGPAIVRVGDKAKNGRWFAVFGNGPFGRIDATAAHQFKGQSTHHLRFFIVDLLTGTLVRTIMTDHDDAFAGTMIGAAIDADRRDSSRSGNYKDDAVYAGFVKKDTTGNWTDGGVVRLMTKEDTNPDNWVWSTVIDNIGPVTTFIARVQDNKTFNKNLWLYFGTGRYYFRDGTGLDDYSSRRSLYGIKEPCYNTTAKPGNFLDGTCTAAHSGVLVDQTSSISTFADTDTGWKIDLDPATTTATTTTPEGAERVVTDTVALSNGVVYFTTFKPTMDICGYGGNSYLWGVNYNTGGQAAANALIGKALIQLSTGEFKEIDISQAFTDKLSRRMGTPMTGKPPSGGMSIVTPSGNIGLKKILHIREH